ncbi:MAG: replicative DNA helicase [Pseudomonas sp.]|nr:replicative DNA helicase [Pseudomonas sp.]
MDTLIQAPFSLEAEQSILGGLMLDNSVWDYVADKLTASDFYKKDHAELFKIISHLAKNDTPFDLITISEYAQDAGVFYSTDILPYAGELCKNIPSVANIPTYCNIVKERSLLRQLATIGFECSRQASSLESSSSQVREDIEGKLFSLTGAKSNSFIDIQATTFAVIDKIDAHFNSDSSITGLDCGIDGINEKTAGLQPAELIVLAARPSMGKTSLGLKFILSALQNAPADKTVQFYSLEMPAEAIIYRMLAMLGRINLHNLKTGDLVDDDWTKLSFAAQKIKQVQSRFVLDDEAQLSPTKLRAKARRAARQFGPPALIVIDYLQLMRSEKLKVESRNLEIAEISASLKALAKEMQCPVIALSQLNRQVEQRPNKRPNNGDLRESGAIEQDADLILFIYRDEQYNPDSQDKGIAEIIISKNRNGPTGIIRTAYIAEQTCFENLAAESFR